MSEADGNISIFIVQHMLDQIARRGVDVESLLRSVGLQSGRIDNSTAWVPLSLCCEMMRAGVAATDDAMMALRFSQTTFTAGFGIVGHVAQACPTLGDVVNAVGRYEQLIGDIFASEMIQEPGASIWSLDIRECPSDVARHMTEFALGTRYLFLHLVREKRSSIVTEIRFRHAPPGKAEDMAVYESIFHCPVRFNQAYSGLVFKPGALALPLRHIDPGLKGLLEAEAERQLAERHVASDIVTKARERLAILVRQGSANRETLAADLGISSRHLHRELSRAGTSYSDMLDELRLARAVELLETDATLEHIGRHLGFQEASSFMRWYRQRTGRTARNMQRGPHQIR